MASEWRTERLCDLYDFSSGLSKPRSEFGFGHGFLTFKDVIDNYFVPNELSALVNSTEKEQASCSIRRGDVFLTRTSETQHELGMSCVALRDNPSATFNGFTKRLRPKSSSAVVPEYAAYYFRSPKFRRDVTSMSSLSTRASLNNEMLSRLSIVLPPVNQQEAIGIILKALDDKIELNRRMNETLEAMARAIFKSWFVDFDPVRAKAEGRDPGLTDEIADLFPDFFADSELGEIPEGWKVGTLADYADLNPESWSKDTTPNEIEYVDLANTKWGKIEETQRYLWKDAPSRAQRILRPGDTIVGTVRPGNGSFAFVSEDGLTGSTGFAVLRPSKAAYAELVYFAATATENIDRLSHLADGAAYPAVRPNVVAATRTVRPNSTLIDRFSGATKPLMAKIAANERESRTLAALRDTLLPKLISGELRVKDAERFLKARGL
jgi:type I restriction enzyme S subunit